MEYSSIFASLLATAIIFSPVIAKAVPADNEDTAANIAQSVDLSPRSMIYDADGRRLGKVVRISDDGSALVIVRDKVVNIPVDTLSEQNGKIVTSLTRKELLKN